MALVYANEIFEKESSARKEFYEKYGNPKFVVFKNDYIFDNHLKAEKGTAARVESWEMKYDVVAKKIDLHLSLCFYLHNAYLPESNIELLCREKAEFFVAFDFEFQNNRKIELIDEKSGVNFGDLFVLLDENDEIMKADKLYSELSEEYLNKKKRFERIEKVISKISLPVLFALGMFIAYCVNFNAIITTLIVLAIIIPYVVYNERYQVRYSKTTKGKQKLIKIKDALYAIDNMSEERI